MKWLAFCLASFMVVSLSAQDWTGNVNSDWENPNNWSGNTLPSNGDDIVIDGDDYVNAPIISANSSFDPGTIEIRDGGILTQTGGDLEVDDDFEIDDGTFIISGGQLDVGGDLQLLGNSTYTQTGGVVSSADDFVLESGDDNVVNISGGQLNIADEFIIDSDDNSVVISGNADVNIDDDIEFEDGIDNNSFQVTDNASLDVLDGIDFASSTNTDFLVDGNAVVNANETDDISQIQTAGGGTANIGGTVLPVELLGFQGTATGKDVLLSWETATEINNDRFEVFHAVHDSDFELLSSLKGAGDSDKLISYSFNHAQPDQGLNYYKLVQYDFDGTKEELETIVVFFDPSNSVNGVFQVHPNPVINELHLNSFSEQLPFSIVDIQGKVIGTGRVGSSNSIKVGALKSGTYIIQILKNGELLQSRFIKN